jgi:hypothetical protein
MRFAECHPDRKHQAKGLCNPCYTKQLLKGDYGEIHKQQVRANYDRYREDMFNALGHTCACCGEPEKVFLSLEHLKQNGNEHRRRVGGNKCSTFSALLDARKHGFPKDEYGVLCMNCQRGTLLPEGCPHKRQAEYGIEGC